MIFRVSILRQIQGPPKQHSFTFHIILQKILMQWSWNFQRLVLAIVHMISMKFWAKLFKDREIIEFPRKILLIKSLNLKKVFIRNWNHNFLIKKPRLSTNEYWVLCLQVYEYTNTRITLFSRSLLILIALKNPSKAIHRWSGINSFF